MKDKKTKGKKVPLDNTNIYPFFKRKDIAKKVLDMIFDEKLEIEEVRNLVLDNVVGKVVSAAVVIACGEKGNYVIGIKRLDNSLKDEENRKLSETIGRTIMRVCAKEKEYSSYLPTIIIFDQTETEECDFLIQYNDMDMVDGKILRFYFIDPDTDDSGPIYDVMKVLATGERGIVPWIDQCMDEMLSPEGKDRDRSYWNDLEKRWKASLGKEMLDLGMGTGKIMDTLQCDHEILMKSIFHYLNAKDGVGFTN